MEGKAFDISTMTLEIFTFCDSADVAEGALSILKIADGIYSAGCPLKIPRFCVVYRIRFHESETGKHKINLSLFNQDGKLLIPPFNKEIVAIMPQGLSTGVKIGIMGLNGIVFPEFGEYSLNLFVDGNLLGSQPLHFLKISLPT